MSFSYCDSTPKPQRADGYQKPVEEIGWQCRQPGIFHRATYREVIEVLIVTVFKTEDFVHRIIEEATDARAAYAGRFST